MLEAMRRQTRQTLRSLGIFPYLQKLSDMRKYRDQPDELIYIHIGKCGGLSLLDAIDRSPVVGQNFSTTSKVHVSKPPILAKSKYLIVVRNPISRALSAFNWRYRLVVDDAVMKDRFKGEYDILKRYGSLNTLSEALYNNGNLDKRVAKDFRAIHHLKEDISFYISDLLKKVTSDQLFAVMATEFLDQDIARDLGVQNVKRKNVNRPSVSKGKAELSEKGRENLRLFLSEDYAAISKLLDLAGIDGAHREALLA